MNSIVIAILISTDLATLKSCLKPIINELQPQDLVLLIDGTKKLTFETVSRWVPVKKKQLKIIKNDEKGIVAGRNLALTISEPDQRKWLYFIDDDAQPLPSWREQIDQSTSAFSTAAYIQGNLVAIQHGYWSRILNFLNILWYQKNIGKNAQIFDFELLDTKNVVLNLNFLQQKKIFFRQLFYLGRSSDSDLGKQIAKAGGKGVFNHRLLIKHREPRNFFLAVEKTIIKAIPHAQFEIYWRNYSAKKSRINRLVFFRTFFAKETLMKKLFFGGGILFLEIINFFVKDLVKLGDCFFKFGPKNLTDDRQ